MFKPFKRKKQPSALQPEKTDEDRLIDQIHSLVGVTVADFEALYKTTLQRGKASLQAGTNSDFINILNNIILALKKRRGYLLPLGADSETSFREREEWTYAVFIAALLKNSPTPEKLNLAKSLMPSQGFTWLQRNKTLFLLWESYLTEKTQINVFTDIIGKTKKESESNPPLIVTNTLEPKQEIRIAEKNENDLQGISHSEALKATLPSDAVIQEVNLHEPSLNEENKEELVVQDGSAFTLPLETSDAILNISAADFFKWLKEGLVSQTITLNQPTSFVHRVQEGILIILSKAVNEYLMVHAKNQDATKTQSVLNQHGLLTKLVKKQNELVRNAKGSRIHSYCVGRWENRQVLSGIVVAAELLLKDISLIPVNSLLSIDPIDN